MLNATGARIIMFTSAAEKDGTSPTVANLALMLARAGKHVVLVDANLRSPVQADHFGLHAPVGLADVLSGTAKLADILTAVDISPVGDERTTPDPGRRHPRSRAGGPRAVQPGRAARHACGG